MTMDVPSTHLGLNVFGQLAAGYARTERMPLLFIGHGNPMLAITDNVLRRT